MGRVLQLVRFLPLLLLQLLLLLAQGPARAAAQSVSCTGYTLLVITSSNAEAIENCPSLTYTRIEIQASIRLPQVTLLDQLTIKGYDTSSDDRIEWLELPNLSKVTESLDISHLAASVSLEFLALTEVPNLTVINCTFASAAFPALSFVEYKMDFLDVSGDLDFPAIEYVVYILHFRNVRGATIAGFDNLQPSSLGNSQLLFENVHDSSIEGFNGRVDWFQITMKHMNNVSVSGFNGTTPGSQWMYFIIIDNITNVTISGFNGYISASMLIASSITSCEISGFSNVDFHQLSFVHVASSRISGFNGNVIGQSLIEFRNMSGSTEVSGFNGAVSTDYDLSIIASPAGSKVAQEALVFSGFNGQVTVGVRLLIQDLSGWIVFSGFRAQITASTFTIQNVDGLEIAPYAFASLHVPDKTSRVSIIGVKFVEGSVLDHFLNLPPSVDPFEISHLILERVTGLQTIRDSFHAFSTFNSYDGSVSLVTMPNLTSIERSFDGLTLLRFLNIKGTGLRSIDLGAFGNVSEVHNVIIQNNPSLVSIDGLLHVTESYSLQIFGNPELRSVAGLCAVKQPNHWIEVDVSDNALLCGDVDHIFPSHPGYISVTKTACLPGSARYVCDCANLDEEMLCPGLTNHCAKVRFGLQCVDCPAHQIYDRSQEACRDCPSGTFSLNNSCQACSLKTPYCSTCTPDACVSCADNFQLIDGACKLKCSGSFLQVTSDIVAELATCAEVQYSSITVLTSANLSNVLAVQDLDIQGEFVAELSMNNLAQVTNLSIRNVTASASIIFPSVATMSMLTLTSVVFPSVSFPALNASSSIKFVGCSGHLDEFRALTSAEDIFFESSSELTISGFNNDLNLGSLRFVGLFSSSVDGFNGNIQCKSLSMSMLAHVNVSGFQGNLTCNSVLLTRMSGRVEFSGFSATNSLKVFSITNMQTQCDFCGGMFTEESESQLVLSGFNGMMTVELFTISTIDAPLHISGFRGTISPAFRFSIDDVKLMHLSPQSFSSLALPSPTVDLSISNVHFEPGMILTDVFNLSPDSLHDTVVTLSLKLLSGLQAIRHSFNGLRSITTQLELSTLSDLSSIHESFTDLETVDLLHMQATNLPSIPYGCFASLESAAQLFIVDNPALTSIDGLLALRQNHLIIISANANLRSVSGLCGLRSSPSQPSTVDVGYNALLCADVAQIFHPDFGFFVQKNDSCLPGSARYVCDCSSFDEQQLCPGPLNHCASVRSGLQCLSCPEHQIFNKTQAACQDCPPGTFSMDNSCQACDERFSRCSTCTAHTCLSCHGPFRPIEGQCQVQCNGSSLQVTSDAVTELESCEELQYTSITVLTSANLSNVISVQDLIIQGDVAQEVIVDNLTQVDHLVINNVASSASIIFPSLVNLHNVTMASVQFPSVSFPVLTNASVIHTTDCSGVFEAFPALESALDIVFANATALQLSAFNDDLHLRSLYFENLADSSIDGFNGNIQCDSIVMRELVNVDVSGFQGFIVADSISLADVRELRLSGFNNDLQLRSIHFAGILNTTIDGFNGNIQCDAIMMRELADVDVSGFQGHINAQSIQLTSMAGANQFSGFSGSLSVGQLSIGNVQARCDFCNSLPLVEEEAGLVLSGFNGNVTADSLVFVNISAPLLLSGFRGLISLSSEFTIHNVDRLQFNSPTFSSFALTSPSLNLSIVDVGFAPGSALSDVFNLSPTSLHDTVAAVSLRSLSGLQTISHSFNGIRSIENALELHTLLDLSSLEHSFVHLRALQLFHMQATNLAAIPYGEFASLESVESLRIQHNPVLESIDGLLFLRQVHSIAIHHNSLLHSVVGLCGLRANVSQPSMVDVSDNALLCADVAEIFHSDFGFVVNSNDSCLPGSARYVCDCASFDEEQLCPGQLNFCASVRSGLQCLGCPEHQIFSKSLAACQDCAPGTFNLNNSCTACDQRFTRCSTCMHDACLSCRGPFEPIQGQCQIQCSGDSLQVTSDVVAEVESCAELRYASITVLVNVNLSNVISVQDLTIEGGALQEVVLENLAQLDNLVINSIAPSTSIVFSSLRGLKNLTMSSVEFPLVFFPELLHASSISIMNCSGHLDAFPALRTAQDIIIEDARELRLSGFNDFICGSLHIERMFESSIDAFNGMVQFDSITMKELVNVNVSGFQGDANVGYLYMDKMAGSVEISGFSRLSLSGEISIGNMPARCDFCHQWNVSEQDSLLVLSGFNDRLNASSFVLSNISSLQIFGFHDIVSLSSEFAIQNVDYLHLSVDAFSTLDLTSPFLDFSLSHVRFAPESSLIHFGNLIPQTAYATLSTLSLRSLSGLHTIEDSFKGIQSIDTLELHTLPDLSSLARSLSHLQTADHFLLQATNLTSIPKGAFPGLSAVNHLNIQHNPVLQSIDGLLGIVQVKFIVVSHNNNLRSVNGLCGLNAIASPPSVVDVSHNALLCADVAQIFHPDFGFVVTSNDSCLPGSARYVCDCDSFDEDVCPVGARCAGVRSGVQCIDCPTGTYSAGKACQACGDLWGSNCSSCSADECFCRGHMIYGVCRVCELDCQNGGQCTLGFTDSFCLCQPGFGGSLCEQSLPSSPFGSSSSYRLPTNNKSRQNFAVSKELVMAVHINTTSGFQLVDAELYEVSSPPLDLVLYRPVVGEQQVGRPTIHGDAASLSASFNASTGIMQVHLTPPSSWLISNHSVTLTLNVELMLTFRISSSPPVPVSDSSVTKKLTMLRMIPSALSSSGLSYTSLSLPPSSISLFPTQDEADRVEFGDDDDDEDGGEGGSASHRSSAGLSNGAVAGIVIGCVVVSVALLVVGSRFIRRRDSAADASSFSSAAVTEMSSVVAAPRQPPSQSQAVRFHY